jgi:hypothetical protein
MLVDQFGSNLGIHRSSTDVGAWVVNPCLPLHRCHPLAGLPLHRCTPATLSGLPLRRCTPATPAPACHSGTRLPLPHPLATPAPGLPLCRSLLARPGRVRLRRRRWPMHAGYTGTYQTAGRGASTTVCAKGLPGPHPGRLYRRTACRCAVCRCAARCSPGRAGCVSGVDVGRYVAGIPAHIGLLAGVHRPMSARRGPAVPPYRRAACRCAVCCCAARCSPRRARRVRS